MPKQKDKPRRVGVVARTHDDLNRPCVTIDPLNRRPISTDPQNPTARNMDDWLARRVATRECALVPLPQRAPRTRKKGGDA